VILSTPGLLEAFWQYLANPLSPDDIRASVTALAFVTSFLTFILTTVLTRVVYIRLQKSTIVVAAALIGSLFLSILELIAHVSIYGVANVFLRSAFVVWTVGLVFMIILLRNVLSVDRITFKKPRTMKTFEPFQNIKNDSVGKFGLSCVDEQLQAATHYEPKQFLFFPILLVAEKYFMPWKIGARFAVAGLASSDTSEGVIYFAFNQPSNIVIDQLARRFVQVMDPNIDPEKYWNPTDETKVPQKFKYVNVIDCHSNWLEKNARPPHACKFTEAHKQIEVLYSDPRNPFDLSNKYKKAIQNLLDNNITSVRVIYDSISDFLIYSDPQIAVQFVKHNMVWEDEVKASSLYIYIPDVPPSKEGNLVDESFLKWNSYCVAQFDHKDSKTKSKVSDTMFLEGLFPEQKLIKVRSDDNGDYHKIDE
jgi:hypothetical protein